MTRILRMLVCQQTRAFIGTRYSDEHTQVYIIESRLIRYPQASVLASLTMDQ